MRAEQVRTFVLPEGVRPADYVTEATPYGLCSKCKTKARHRANHYYCRDCSNQYQRDRYQKVSVEERIASDSTIADTLGEILRLAQLCSCGNDLSFRLTEKIVDVLVKIDPNDGRDRDYNVATYQGKPIFLKTAVDQITNFAVVGDKDQYDHWLDVAKGLFPKYDAWPEFTPWPTSE